MLKIYIKNHQKACERTFVIVQKVLGPLFSGHNVNNNSRVAVFVTSILIPLITVCNDEETSFDYSFCYHPINPI